MKHTDLTSTSDMIPRERVGWVEFWSGRSVDSLGGDPHAARGWWFGHRYAYADGFHEGAIGSGEENPHPQHSGAWEAWGDGNNDALIVFHGVRM